MLDPPALLPAVAAVRPLAVSFTGLAYRAIRLQYFANFATAQPLFTAPGGVAGSRYLLPSGPAALYLALDPETAYREANQNFYRTARTAAGRALVRAGKLRPDTEVTIGVHLRVSQILDLRRETADGRQSRRALGIRSNRELLGPWAGIANAPTQILGAEVFNDAFFEGILYPSAQNRGRTCLVLFRPRLLTTSQVDFRDGPTGLEARLP